MLARWNIYLLNKDIPSQEDGECDTDNEEDITPTLLWGRPHKLFIINTDQKTDGEDRKKAAIEHLRHQDDHNTIN